MRRTAAAMAAVTLAVPLLVSCSGQAPPKAAPAAQAPAKTVLVQSAADIARTAGSMKQLDDLPLYEMTYYGDYDAEAPLAKEELARQVDGWACSLYHRPGEFGRNFDWNPNPAMIVRADPPNGYASLSVVDVFYTLDRQGPPDLKNPVDRRRLAHAVLSPFDGMNEKGLAVGFASVPTADLPAPMAGRPTVDSARIIRLLLDRAASVDEAVALMRTYNVEHEPGPQVHYLIADRVGRSVVVEYGGGRLNVVEDHVLTNFTMTGSTLEQRMDDTRYRTLAENLSSKADGLALLESVAQAHTRWSIVYDLDVGTARIVAGQKWSKVHAVGINPG